MPDRRSNPQPWHCSRTLEPAEPSGQGPVLVLGGQCLCPSSLTRTLASHGPSQSGQHPGGWLTSEADPVNPRPAFPRGQRSRLAGGSVTGKARAGPSGTWIVFLLPYPGASGEKRGGVADSGRQGPLDCQQTRETAPCSVGAGRTGFTQPADETEAQSCLPERAHTSALMTPTPLVLQRPSHLEHPRGGGLVECRALDPPPRFCFRGQGWAPVPAMLTLPVPPHPGLQLGYVSCVEPRVAAPARSEVLVTSAQGDW